LTGTGLGPIAAGVAAFATGFISYMCLTLDRGPADVGSRADAGALFVSDTIDPKWDTFTTAAVGVDMRGGSRMRLASLATEFYSPSAFTGPDDSSEPATRSSFGERFALDPAGVPDRFSQRLQATASFDDRFIDNTALATPTAAQSAAAAPLATAPGVAAAAAAPRAATRSTVARAAPKRSSEARVRLASADASHALAYAPTDPVKASLTPNNADPLGEVVTSRTAIYDIAARTVYMPNGRRLEAHSGFGAHMDDIRYVKLRMTGPTPPNVYNLRMRESLFHGVQAIRLIPADGAKMHGRAGILAHSYMLGPNGQSNGCVSIRDYQEFLDAYLRGEVDRIVVVERLAQAPAPRTAADWFKDLFRGS
jgi:Protein of unknown function (DUF2778)